MSYGKERYAEVGDLVIQKGDIFGAEEPVYFGVVYEVDIIGGYDSVFMVWTPEEPPGYDDRFGYVRTNIHNGHTQFEVIKK